MIAEKGGNAENKDYDEFQASKLSARKKSIVYDSHFMTVRWLTPLATGKFKPLLLLPESWWFQSNLRTSP